MWGRAMGGAPRLLPLLLLLPGAVGLECLSCGAEDGTCRGATNVTCPPESDVCAEALAAVTWSHGRLALGGRGCGRGAAGANARALQLFGLVLFVRRRQCRGGGGCNSLLPLGLEGALPLPGNESARVPNGVRCYGCPDAGPCPPTTVVQCYGDLRGCFHGNVTLTLGGVTLWREVRGCVRDQSCTQESRGDDAVGLRGSCCAGDLCNRHLANKTFFAPDLPRLELLPHGHAPTAPPNATRPRPGLHRLDNATAGAPKMAATRAKMAAAGAGVTAAANGVNGAVNGVNGDLNGVNGDLDGVNGAINGVNSDLDGVNGDLNRVNGDLNGVNGDLDGVDGDLDGVTDDLTGDVSVNGGWAGGAAGDKMAAGRAASGAGRPLERKDEVKGPVGRGQPLAGPGWLLPFLLLPLL